ncbi:MAG TPA: FHA domain-containing protein, partial [Steroidobacteraceae bacterium]|nr:FHA domain-containing protein [Steroidobacteraceae bacterium]
DHARADAAVAAAQAQIAELSKAVKARDAADEERRARDTDLQAQLAQRHTEFQLQLSAVKRDFEAQTDARARSMALLERQLEEARARAASYLETLQSSEGRRSVFEDLLTSLDADVGERDASIARLETDLGTHIGRARDLETQLTERVARIAALEKQVNGLSSSLAQRSELQTDVERARDGLQQTVNSLSATLAVRNERIRALEETVAQQTNHAASQRAELERVSHERAQLLAGAASLEASVKAATARGDEQTAAAAAAKTRIEELEASLAGQRRRVEQLESEAAAIRGELQSSSTALQAAAAERAEHVARISSGESRMQELEAQLSDQQDVVRQLQAEAIASAARIRDLEQDLAAAEESLNRLEGEARAKSTRVDELERINQEWRTTVEEARHAIKDRDSLIQRLEQETAHSAVLVGHIQRSITRLDHGADHPHVPVHEPAPDGATRLLIRTDGETEVVHVLGRKTTVGRTPDNDLQIDAKFISRHHAVILAGPAHTIIEDLNSTNGVMINNRRVTRQPLKDGDTVMIGKTQFRYVVRAAKS